MLCYVASPLCLTPTHECAKQGKGKVLQVKGWIGIGPFVLLMYVACKSMHRWKFLDVYCIDVSTVGYDKQDP